MSRTKIVLAGEGGQGVQSIAKILVEAGTKQESKYFTSRILVLNKEVVFLLPSAR